jgi:methionyl-tRNA formyltransferase
VRIGFFGQSGPFAPRAFGILWRELRGHELVVVVEGQRALPGRHEHKLLKPDPRPPPTTDELALLATAAGLPAIVTRDVNDGGMVRRLKVYDLDLIVCVGFDRLFSPAILATAGSGAVNAHPSALPELRGPSPIFWALKLGWRRLAVTLHALDRREDHGVVFDQEPFALPHRASGAEIYSIAGDLAGSMLVHLMEGLRGALPPGMPQDHARATRAPRPRPEDVEVVPGAWSSEHLADFACGAPYFRAPFLKLGDDTFFVRRAIDTEPGRRLPAQYVLSGSTLFVQCKDGVVALEIQV